MIPTGADPGGYGVPQQRRKPDSIRSVPKWVTGVPSFFSSTRLSLRLELESL